MVVLWLKPKGQANSSEKESQNMHMHVAPDRTKPSARDDKVMPEPGALGLQAVSMPPFGCCSCMLPKTSNKLSISFKKYLSDTCNGSCCF